MTRTIEIRCPSCLGYVFNWSPHDNEAPECADSIKKGFVVAPCSYCGSDKWRELFIQGKAYTPRGIEAIGGGA